MRDDIKIYYITEPNHDYYRHLVFSIKSKNSSGYKYYIMNMPNNNTNETKLKRIDNAVLLLSEIQTMPIRIQEDKDEYLTAIGLLEMTIKNEQSKSLSSIKEMLDNEDTLNKIKKQRERMNLFTSTISTSDVKTITDRITK